LYAKTSGNGQGPVGPQGPQGNIGSSGDDGIDGTNGSDGNDGSDGADGNGIAQTLLISGDTLFISSGNYILIPGLSLINSLIAEGCTDPTALNYDASANTDDGSCISVVLGCTDATACNYNSVATENDASCTYAEANLDCDGNAITLNYSIGDLAHGGIVFYIDATGEHGLVAALEDLTEGSNMGYSGTPEGFEWGCYGSGVSGADGDAIGTGYQNTLDISAQNCQTENGGITAAQATLNYETEGFTDWFLPSKEELEEMYNTIGNGGSEGNIGGFETSDYPYYWSSSEYSSNSAWFVNFSTGPTNVLSKDYSLRVRAVRAFGNQAEVLGCMDNTACNYASLATETGNCDYALPNYDCQGTCLNDMNSNGICDEDEVLGCMDATACNYNSVSTENDASCTYAEANLDCDGNPISLNYSIGDLAEGGIIFYVDETGEHGLVAALEDLTEGSNMGNWGTPEGFEWGCYGSGVSGAEGEAIGTGYQNTLDISAQNCQTENGGITAAQATLNYETEGFTDWFLPSRYELLEMYSTIGNGGLQGNIGGFETSDTPWYWSSSESYNYYAWLVYFSSGGSNYDYEDSSLRVRAVRAF
jgi:type II secretory pathway pseudopilin PulG